MIEMAKGTRSFMNQIEESQSVMSDEDDDKEGERGGGGDDSVCCADVLGSVSV